MLLGETLSAAEAASAGIFAEVCESRAAMVERAIDYARRLAALDPHATREARRILPPRSATKPRSYRRELAALAEVVRAGWPGA
jgi:enoyl-CoA hydratase/carnithine racemase